MTLLAFPARLIEDQFPCKKASTQFLYLGLDEPRRVDEGLILLAGGIGDTPISRTDGYRRTGHATTHGDDKVYRR